MADIQTYYQKYPDTKLKPLPNDILIPSQGVKDVMRWKGLPLYKSVYDFALISMILWKLQPKTIFEMDREREAVQYGCQTFAECMETKTATYIVLTLRFPRQLR